MKIWSYYKIIKKHLKPVFLHNAVTLVNGIFLVVSVLLLLFKEFHESVFLLVVLVLNVVIGIFQDLRAKVTLEQLQILMAPKIIRLGDGGAEQTIGLDDVLVGDRVKISLGDQIPADGELIESNGVEVNEALLTGESENKRKKINDKVLAGSVVVSGSGILKVKILPKDSFVSKMTEKIKRYKLNLSPIQQTLNTFIRYMTYLLLAIMVYVILHGLSVHELLVSIVKDVAALTSTLVPQGLILATTIFFAYGAVKMFKKQVLLQEINATEKLGRIKNLCIDKTGTLTENRPEVQDIILYGQYGLAEAQQLTAGYINANNDTSHTGKALQQSVKHQKFLGSVLNTLPFSSERSYGGATLKVGEKLAPIVMGAPDVLLKYLANPQQHEWVVSQINKYAPMAKRLVLLTISQHELPESDLEKDSLFPVALFVLSNPLRPGTKEIINFFQNQGVSIRVISGDNPQTVKAVAEQAGVKHTDIIITGEEMEKWDAEEYLERVPAYHLFARIKPQQKERIISVLRKSGYTAMVGDGANDALAIKKADLGIAMFDGAPATRQIAEVVLMNNSFSALPAGVNLAETIITNIELVAGVFFNSITIGLALFFMLAILNYTYPLSPRNTTIINYCILWLPLAYWAVFPTRKSNTRGNKSFLMKILPFSLLNGALTAIAAVAVFWFGPAQLKTSGSNSLVVLVCIALGYWFFLLAPEAYGALRSRRQQKVTYFLGGIVAVFLVLVMTNPALSDFFDLRLPGLIYLLLAASAIFLCGLLQHQIAKKWFFQNADS